MIPIVDPETSTPILASGKLVVLGSVHIRWPEEKTTDTVFPTQCLLDNMSIFSKVQWKVFQKVSGPLEFFPPSVQSGHNCQRRYIGLKATLAHWLLVEIYSFLGQIKNYIYRSVQANRFSRS